MSANNAEQVILNRLSQLRNVVNSSARYVAEDVTISTSDGGSFAKNTSSDLLGVVSQQSFLTSHNSLDLAATATEPITQALVSSEAHTEDAMSLSSASSGMARRTLPSDGSPGDADHADVYRELMSSSVSEVARGILPSECSTSDARQSDQEVAEADDARLRFPVTNLAVSGIPPTLLQQYEVDRSQGGGKRLMRDLGQANISQEQLVLLSKCALSEKALDDLRASLRDVLPEATYKDKQKLLKQFIKPYVLSTFDFVINWTGGNMIAKQVAASFENITTKLKEFGFQDEFFNLNEAQGRSVSSYYQNATDSNVKFGKIVGKELKDFCKDQEFTPEQAIYYLLKQDANERDSDMARRSQRIAFTRLYLTNPNRNPQLHFQRAHILASEDDLEAAIDALQIVAEYAPKEPPVHATTRTATF